MKDLPARPRLFARAAFFAVLLALLPVFAAWGQTQMPVANPASRVEGQMRAADAVTMVSGQTVIRLWGIDKVGGQSPAFDVRGRTVLDNAIGQGKVICDIKTRGAGIFSAQCNSSTDQDLSLFMLQQGFATVDRALVYGTVFEDAYIQAEMQAQSKGIGVWGGDAQGGEQSAGQSGYFISILGFILFLCIIGAFTFISIIIMRGFQKVIDAQNQNAEMVSRERKLREKERDIVAIMLDSELKANKSKIEAYCVVYEEMLKGLKETSRPPRYKKAGDIIQKQPALVRSVFDRNTDKLDMLEGRVSSELVHFYARIKTHPDYVNLEPTTPVEEAIALLEAALKNARRLDELATKLLSRFSDSGVVSEDYRE